MYRNFWFGHFSNEAKLLRTEKKFGWNSWETTWNSLNKKMNGFMTSFPRKDDVVFIGRCCQSMPFERQRLKCVMQEWRQVAKVANEQVIRQLVNTCPGKITLVHHSSRGRRQDFSNIGSVELSLSDVTLLIKWLPLEKKVDGKFCGKNRRRSRNARSPKSCAIDSNWRPEVTTLHICP